LCSDISHFFHARLLTISILQLDNNSGHVPQGFKKHMPTSSTKIAAVMRPAYRGLGVEAVCATPTFSALADTERDFLIAAHREKQRRVKDREKSAERREADTHAIEAIANAMVEIAEGDLGDIRQCDREQVAAASDQTARTVDRLWRDATWLALAGGGILTPERELEIAYDALASSESLQSRAEKSDRPYSARQKNIVRRHTQHHEYLRKTENEPSPRRLTQSGWERVNVGYCWEKAGRVGGATQPDGQGKYLNLPFVEAGFRSNTARGAILKRLVAATAKVGARRRGISNPKTIKEILRLDGMGKSVVKIAADVGESVNRVNAVIWNRVNDSVLRTGLTNDNRITHLYKRVALDQIHGNLRTDCKDVFRAVDLDRDFEDVEELIQFISKRKAKPQIAVWVRDDEHPDKVQRPHLVFMLPEGSGVWYGERVGSAMLEAVAAAICVDYGGDSGALANIFDTKLATSPHTDFICPETEHLPTLSELCKLYDVDLRNDLTRVARQQTVKRLVDAGVDKTTSMNLYTLYWKRGWETANLWESTGDLRIDAGLDRIHFHEEIVGALLKDAFVVAELDKLDDRQRAGAEKALRSAARSVSEKYGRNRRLVSGRGFDIGAAETETERAVAAAIREAREAYRDADAGKIKKVAVRAAQQVGQDYARRQRISRNVRRVCDHIGITVDAGREPTVEEIAESAGLDKRTVKKHWDAAIALLAANRIVAAVIRPLEAVVETPETSVETTAITPAISSNERGVTVKGSSEDIAADTWLVEIPASRDPLKVANLVPAPLMSLVNRLSPWNPASGRPPLGRNLLEFCMPGFTVYRPASGWQGRSARGRIGRAPVNARKPAEPTRAADPMRMQEIGEPRHSCVGRNQIHLSATRIAEL
jgi:hypothetical protein